MFIPLQTVFLGRYTIFMLSVRVSVRPFRFVSLISLRVIDGISLNIVYTFIST